jgi:hypothetical protein
MTTQRPPTEVGHAHVTLAQFLFEVADDAPTALVVVEAQAIDGAWRSHRSHRAHEGHVDIVELGCVRHDHESLHGAVGSERGTPGVPEAAPLAVRRFDSIS